MFVRKTIAFVYVISLVEGGRKKEPNWKKNLEESEMWPLKDHQSDNSS